MGFVLTFFLNLLFSGVMSQLWNIFNTLQIIMALPLLAVLMPANVLLVMDALNQIVNFSVVDKEIINSKIVEPLFGDEEQEKSSLINMIQILVLASVATLIILLFLICKRTVYPRCCGCFKKIVDVLLSKLMFNSILRACMQTFFSTSLGLWMSFRTASTDTKLGRVDLGMAILLFVYLLLFPCLTLCQMRKK